ncbi:biotin-dependent carboxyltransferase family protein [Paenibacillus montanisoli]|uniref:Allophanate hydrolase subunit 2 family protein n=1 Tax=Paenibacillus montanisoli TaxID=2081970 RepID=A0A328U8U8_9BACL|nr:biotin-dependent carboxyltransferase family protein [Paenibacillus montanisoli]RAP77335.1 allophanate hydrolase subunit 2 family protein [Paenibacillus montanisoli]
MRILKPGLHTTIQDLGRAGWRAFGIPEGGAMDSIALRTANLLVGNDQGAAGLELTLTGPQLVAEKELLIAVCGAGMAPFIDGEPLPLERPVWIAAGTVITFGPAASGCRAYLAAAGGIAAEAALGSRGTDTRAGIGGVAGRPLRAGDVLPLGSASPQAAAWRATLAARAAAKPQGRRSWAAPGWFAPPPAQLRGRATPSGIRLRVMPGAEYGQFREAARTALLRERFRVAPASDRMGVRLEGPPLPLEDSDQELLSHGVIAGTIQVPRGGAPIILGADCQTTGGYPKLAHVITADLPLLAQCKPGDDIAFELVTLAEAQRGYMEQERDMRMLAAAIALRMRKN